MYFGIGLIIGGILVAAVVTPATKRAPAAMAQRAKSFRVSGLSLAAIGALVVLVSRFVQ